MTNYLRFLDGIYNGTEFENCSFCPAIKTSLGSIHIKIDKSTSAEFDKLTQLSEKERISIIKAIKYFVEPGGRRSKSIQPFLMMANAFKVEFKKRKRILFEGNKYRSIGHLRMPNDEEMLNNPLYVADLGSFFPLSRASNEKYDQLKKNHPHLENEQSLFNKTNNSVIAFDLFVKSIESGVYPPLELLKWLSERMKQFLEVNGSVNLNHIFGFEKPGRGKNKKNAFAAIKEAHSDAHELLSMAALIDYFDLTVQEASAFMARTGKYESASSYERKWYSDWNHLLKNHDQLRTIYQTIVLNRSGLVDDDSKLRFLDNFGPYGTKEDVIPPQIYNYLKKHGKL